ncbi:uroporphyrinogen-III C-methyltransferase [Shewanella avicenniae]|uniref:uroporphyrinogen-III C-methyltransferase n=1 Tax=Shewanella avicenniae TaxID=2814294 RepID=A0ABX7QN97_9GAMM|nr:uroporphyrinogen-III C-methyltransferase [Shewanella avicenniae]QSX32370.1 uroporphyrinogen-III C-methyltransferase [Shewanella avicenniae]
MHNMQAMLASNQLPQLMAGEVALVGAGCGSLGNLTLAAFKLISTAEAVVFDALVDSDILALLPESCERYDMGKRGGVVCGGKVSSSQDAINHKLLSLAQRGLKVLRLKGGDPNVFGRGTEEALFLAEHGIKSQFVAGVTAALGCAAAAAIPLTHRGVSRSVTLVTGHQASGNTTHHWRALLDLGSTLVFYMGKDQAQKIAASLLLAGGSSELPMVFISAGCRDSQQLHYATVGTMAAVAKTISSEGPTLMIIGEVVAVGRELQQLINDIDVGEHQVSVNGGLRHAIAG